MDYIVTIPKKMKHNVLQREIDSTKNGKSSLNIKMRMGRPINLNKKSKVYILYSGLILGFMMYSDFSELERTCEGTGIIWKKKFLMLTGGLTKDSVMVSINFKHEGNMKGFVGVKELNEYLKSLTL